MVLFLIIFGSIVTGLAIISALLVLFVRKALHNDLQKLARVITGLLILQFVLGMLANLFQQVPTFEPWRVFHDFGPIILHTANALFLLILSVIFLIYACRRRIYKIGAILGTIAVVCAFASGVTFVNAGQNDIFSFTMSLGFITAIMVYAFVAFRQPISRKSK